VIVTSQKRLARVLVEVTAESTPGGRERAAFEELYERHGRRVYAFLARLAGSRALADDLFQETWLRIARGWATTARAADVEAWVFTVARNVFLSGRRGRLAQQRGLERLRLLPEPAVRSPDDELEAARNLGALEQAFGELGHEDRSILWLAAIEEMDQARVAEIMGLSYSALRQRLSRARARLAARLAPAPPAARSRS
jgi:RNA polymerase sigma factor (sigma-70 family)